MTASTSSLLPHHRLKAYGVALELLRAVRDARITDRDSRDQAIRAAKSACRNCAEGAGRVSGGDKARMFGIARGEAVEAICAVEIAVRPESSAHSAASDGVSAKRIWRARCCTIADEERWPFHMLHLHARGAAELRKSTAQAP